MRIGLFSDCYYPQVNGVITSIMLLKESLEVLGHEVFVITVKAGNYDDSEEENIIRVPSVPFPKWKEFRVGIPTFFHSSYQEIQKLNLDIVHTHTEFPLGFLGRHYAKKHNLPLVHTYHTMYEDYTHYVSNFGEPFLKSMMKTSSKLYVNGYDLIVVPSRKTGDALRSYGVKAKMTILPTGIDIQQFARLPKGHKALQEIAERYHFTAENRVLLSLGRVSKEKSIDVLIRSMPKLITKNPHIRLLIVGDGPYKVTLEDMTRELQLQDYVFFTGQIPFADVPKYYSLADVFVNASKTETQGLTIFEAMASRLPVIVYDDKNVEDVVVSGISGRLFTSAAEYEAAVLDAISAPEKTLQMAEKGKEIVDSLSKDAFGIKIAKIYQTLIRRKQTEPIQKQCPLRSWFYKRKR